MQKNLFNYCFTEFFPFQLFPCWFIMKPLGQKLINLIIIAPNTSPDDTHVRTSAASTIPFLLKTNLTIITSKKERIKISYTSFADLLFILNYFIACLTNNNHLFPFTHNPPLSNYNFTSHSNTSRSHFRNRQCNFYIHFSQ